MRKSPQNRFLLPAALLCLVDVSGCETHIRHKNVLPTSSSPIVTPTRIAPPNKPQPLNQLPPHLSAKEIQHRLQKIETLITSGECDSAKDIADTLNANVLSISQQSQLNLLYTQILLNFGEAEQSIEKLALIDPFNLDQANKIKFYQSQAFAFSLSGNLLESVQSRIELQHLLPANERLENQAAII